METPLGKQAQCLGSAPLQLYTNRLPFFRVVLTIFIVAFLMQPLIHMVFITVLKVENHFLDDCICFFLVELLICFGIIEQTNIVLQKLCNLSRPHLFHNLLDYFCPFRASVIPDTNTLNGFAVIIFAVRTEIMLGEICCDCVDALFRT